MSLFFLLKSGNSGPLTNLDGQIINTTGTGQGSAYSGIRFNTDGTVDEYKSHGAGTWEQIDAATDWIVPNSSAANATYHVRVQSTPPTDDFTTSPGANGTWFALTGGSGSNREWGVEDFNSTIESIVQTGNVTFEISDDAGTTVIASGTYSLSANWRGP